METEISHATYMGPESAYSCSVLGRMQVPVCRARFSVLRGGPSEETHKMCMLENPGGRGQKILTCKDATAQKHIENQCCETTPVNLTNERLKGAMGREIVTLYKLVVPQD